MTEARSLHSIIERSKSRVFRGSTEIVFYDEIIAPEERADEVRLKLRRCGSTQPRDRGRGLHSSVR